MELAPHTQQMLEDFELNSLHSPIFPIVAPLLDPMYYSEENQPVRFSEQKNSFQVLWEKSKWGSNDFERICLTLASNSLTIALSHRHDSFLPNQPVNSQKHPYRSTLIIDTDSHTLFQTHQHRPETLPNLHGRRAVTRFSRGLSHSLKTMGLYIDPPTDYHEPNLNVIALPDLPEQHDRAPQSSPLHNILRN